MIKIFKVLIPLIIGIFFIYLSFETTTEQDRENILMSIKNADYKYRSYIKREDVASVISNKLINIDYDNFKSSVSKDDNIRSNAYMNVWSALNKIQS